MGYVIRFFIEAGLGTRDSGRSHTTLPWIHGGVLGKWGYDPVTVSIVLLQDLPPERETGDMPEDMPADMPADMTRDMPGDMPGDSKSLIWPSFPMRIGLTNLTQKHGRINAKTIHPGIPIEYNVLPVVFTMITRYSIPVPTSFQTKKLHYITTNT